MNKINPLLSKALEFKKPTTKTFSDDEIELAVALVKSEVSPASVTKVIGKNAFQFMLSALRFAFSNGKIKVEQKF